MELIIRQDNLEARFSSLLDLMICLTIPFYPYSGFSKMFFSHSVTGEIAEVAMALLPFLLKANAKDGHSKQQAFLHFIPVSIWLKHMNFIFDYSNFLCSNNSNNCQH